MNKPAHCSINPKTFNTKLKKTSYGKQETDEFCTQMRNIQNPKNFNVKNNEYILSYANYIQQNKKKHEKAYLLCKNQNPNMSSIYPKFHDVTKFYSPRFKNYSKNEIESQVILQR